MMTWFSQGFNLWLPWLLDIIIINIRPDYLKLFNYKQIIFFIKNS